MVSIYLACFGFFYHVWKVWYSWSVHLNRVEWTRNYGKMKERRIVALVLSQLWFTSYYNDACMLNCKNIHWEIFATFSSQAPMVKVKIYFCFSLPNFVIPNKNTFTTKQGCVTVHNQLDIDLVYYFWHTMKWVYIMHTVWHTIIVGKIFSTIFISRLKINF